MAAGVTLAETSVETGAGGKGILRGRPRLRFSGTAPGTPGTGGGGGGL